jgi:uncharacterized protein YegL
MKKININCIIDMSGSMESIIKKARKGFNKFLNEQKESNNQIDFSLMFFDTEFYMPYKNVDIKSVENVNKKTYYARGGTALYDAIGKMIDDYVDYLGVTSSEDRPNKTLFVILTDGEENSSRVYHKELIKNMVTDMREGYNTEFVYLGANQDSCFQAESMGMSGSNAFNYDATNDGITVAYSKISTATAYYADSDVKENLFQQ